jgi:hypothetical protein
VARSPAKPAPASEREGLTQFLDQQRDILVRKIEGVTDQQARLAPTASSLSLLGILKHCALWERRWFQVIFAGRNFPGDWPEVRSPLREDFKVGEDDTVAHWLGFYQEQVEERKGEGEVGGGSWRPPTSARHAPGSPNTTSGGCCCTTSRRSPGTPGTPTSSGRPSTAPWASNAADSGPRSAND